MAPQPTQHCSDQRSLNLKVLIPWMALRCVRSQWECQPEIHQKCECPESPPLGMSHCGSRRVNLAEWIHYWMLRMEAPAMPLVADINRRLQLLLQYDSKASSRRFQGVTRCGDLGLDCWDQSLGVCNFCNAVGTATDLFAMQRIRMITYTQCIMKMSVWLGIVVHRTCLQCEPGHGLSNTKHRYGEPMHALFRLTAIQGMYSTTLVGCASRCINSAFPMSNKKWLCVCVCGCVLFRMICFT